MNLPNQVVADYETIETDFVCAARAIAAYHQELRRGKVPPALAAQLTIEFARQWWISQLGLNEQHVYMHGDEEGEE